VCLSALPMRVRACDVSATSRPIDGAQPALTPAAWESPLGRRSNARNATLMRQLLGFLLSLGVCSSITAGGTRVSA
jgi:hypothetical protein